MIKLDLLYYTQIHSFIMEIKTDCIYQEMKNNLDKYDTSDNPVYL